MNAQSEYLAEFRNWINTHPNASLDQYYAERDRLRAKYSPFIKKETEA